MNKHKLETEKFPHNTFTFCSVCGCRETDLPTECPGYELSVGVKTRIYSGDIDFVDGAWYHKASGWRSTPNE